MSKQQHTTPPPPFVPPDLLLPDALFLSLAHRAELDRRLDALERNPDSGRPWPEVRDELLRR